MAHSAERLADDLRALGVVPGATLMVHSSLSALGWVEGGAETVIDALLAALGPEGTLVMPAFRDTVSVEGIVYQAPKEALAEARATAPFDPASTPTTSGAIPEAFRQRPGVRRSGHYGVSVTARGPQAEAVVNPHAPSWGQGPESPFERLYEWDAQLLLLGVGFNRLTMLHYAEWLVPHGRRKTRLIPEELGVLLAPDIGDDLNTHFPEIGRRFLATRRVRAGRVGDGAAMLMRAQPVVEFAKAYLENALPRGGRG